MSSPFGAGLMKARSGAAASKPGIYQSSLTLLVNFVYLDVLGVKLQILPKGDILKPALSCFDHNTANNGLSQLMLMPPDHSNCLAPLFLNLLLGDQADGKQMAGGGL